MKRNIIRTLFAACVTSAMLLACDPLEPTTYTENFYRVATVQYIKDKASLLLDYTGETYLFDNFSTAADMDQFEVKAGDRIIAGMTLSAIENIANNKLHLDEVYPLPIGALAESRPSDTINYRYWFDYLYLINYKYPKIWSQGHFVNLAPSFYLTSEKKVPQFYLYPMDVKNDTLIMRLFADIPDTLSTNQYSLEQTLLCYDVSTLRDPVSNPAQKAYRDSLYHLLSAMNKDSITVQIFSADTLRDKIMTSDGVVERKFFPFPRAQVSVSIPFDF